MPSGVVMAEPKQAKGKGASPKGASKATAPIRTIGFKASQEWSDWLERFAKTNRTTVAGVIDRALAEMAKVQEHPEPPPERVP